MHTAFQTHTFTWCATLLTALLWASAALAAPETTATKSLIAPSVRSFLNAAPRSDAAFPPFFGNDAPAPDSSVGTTTPAPAAPSASSRSPLEGRWFASDGKDSIEAVFHGSNFQLALNVQQKISGIFSIEGATLRLQATNGKQLSFVWKVQGDQLHLDDIVLARQTGAQTPMPAPSNTAQGGLPTPLEGVWVASSGGQSVSFTFQGNGYILILNGQRFTGTFRLEGDRLITTAATGQVANMAWSIQGNQLILEHGDTILIRQGTGTGSASPMPAPTPQTSAYTSPLDGRWAASTGSGTLVFVFSGKQYQALLNGRPIEAGAFAFGGNVIHFNILSGQHAGRQTTNAISLDKNGLIFAMRFPDGSFTMFHRQ